MVIVFDVVRVGLCRAVDECKHLTLSELGLVIYSDMLGIVQPQCVCFGDVLLNSMCVCLCHIVLPRCVFVRGVLFNLSVCVLCVCFARFEPGTKTVELLMMLCVKRYAVGVLTEWSDVSQGGRLSFEFQTLVSTVYI